jgi:type VI secretion system protein ImpK
VSADDPFRSSDSTVVRPRPGAGKRSGGGVPPEPSPLRAVSDVTTLGDAIPIAPGEPTSPGLSPLVQAASPLLQLAAHVRGTLATPDVAALRHFATEEIRRFETQARQAGIASEMVMAARYAICAALDEAVLSTPWGGQSEWAQQTLLNALHREAWGGKKFFEMLERISKDPTRYRDLMEVQYLCVAFGFAGQYRVQEQGATRLADIQHEIFRRIQPPDTATPIELSIRWRGVEDRRSRLVRYAPWWMVAAGALALLAGTFAFYYATLGRATSPVQAALSRIGEEDFKGASPPAPPASEPRLKQLLAGDERQGTLSVTEEGGRTRIILTGRDLFKSGSAAPNSAYDPMLKRIADALNQVPGRVLVEGHTDDQPLQSLQFSNNVELSQARAVSVARLLQRSLTNPARLETSGAGSSQPLYTPETLPENRARNRRVEIIHVRGT